MNFGEKDIIDIMIVLEALWSNQRHPQATKIIEEYKRKINKFQNEINLEDY